MKQILEQPVIVPVSEETLDEIVEMERRLDEIKADEILLPAFLTLLVEDDTIGSQLQQHFADYFGSQGMMK